MNNNLQKLEILIKEYIKNQAVNPFAVAHAKAKEMGYENFSEGSPGKEKASEIAEAIKGKK